MTNKTKMIIFGIIVTIILGIYFLVTSQYGAKKLGGTYTIKLKEQEKLVNVTWKEDEIWLLTRKARKGDVQDEYVFQEDAKFNMIEGKVKIKENISFTNK